MRKSSIVAIFFLSGFSCQDNNEQIISKSPKKLKKVIVAQKEISCYDVEKKVFFDLISNMQTEGSKLKKFKDWNLRFKNHIKPNYHNPNDTFIVLPENTVWKGKIKMKEYYNRENTNIRFKNTRITEVVVNQYKNKKFVSNIKIVQFLFQSKVEAQNATEKLKLISYYTTSTDGLKTPNLWWIHDCAIYFCRILSSNSSFLPFIETFEKKHGEVKKMSW